MKVIIHVRMEEPFELDKTFVENEDGTQTLRIKIEDALEVNTMLEKEV